MEITLKVDKVFNEMCENAGTRLEVVLKCFMWDVMIAGEGRRAAVGDDTGFAGGADQKMVPMAHA